MGSRRTHEDRDRRLRESGLTQDELARLHSPIGLDLGARTPEETALSIAAEIVAARHGGTGLPLSDSRTPIHHDTEGRHAWRSARTAVGHDREPTVRTSTTPRSRFGPARHE